MESGSVNNQKFNFLLNNLSGAAIIFDDKLNLIEANKEFSSLFNLSFAKTKSQKLDDLIRFSLKGSDVSRQLNELSGSKVSSIIIDGKLMGMHNPNADRHISIFIQKLVHLKNQYIGFVNLDEEERDEIRPDISDKHLFKLLLNELPDAIYFKDLMGRFFLTNKLHIKKLGFKHVDEFIGKTDFDLFSKEHAQQAFNDEQQVIHTENTIVKEEKETHLDGRETWASTSKMPLRNEQGKIVGTFGISKDITQIKIAEIQLRHAEKILQEANAAKDKFFSILAHDLKNPFNSLIGLSELLVEEFNDFSDDEVLDMVTRIRQTSESAYALLENLLDWSRVQRGSMSMNPGKILLKDLVADVLEVSYLHAHNKKIKINIEVPEALCVIADENMLRTVLRNLISNAVKFTNSGGEIKVGADKDGKMVQVFVEDNGLGMDEGTLKKLFQISERVKTYGTADESGTGLGLIIVNEFVQKNQGTISVESKEGKGSKFTFTLPADRRNEPRE